MPDSSNIKSSATAASPARVYNIDWLRVIAMATIFLFHSAVFFSDERWFVKNNEISLGMTIFVFVIIQWTMPLFFVLSGISSNFALNFRSGGKYITERVKRLIIPLIFGIFVLAPPQVYLERLSHGEFSGSLFSFYFPHYFDGFYGFGGNFAWMGLHLWYLLILFIFSVITLPLFLWWKRESLKSFISRLSDFFTKPYTIFLLALPLSAMEIFVTLFPESLGRRDFGGWSPLTYLLFFVLGYIIATDRKFIEAAKKHAVISLIVGVSLTIYGVYLKLSGFELSPEAPAIAVFFLALRGFRTWCWLVAILGFGSMYLNFNNRALKYANEAVLPFYILHQTVIVIIAYYLINWGAGVMVKYLVLSVSSFVVIMALYDLIVKRVGALRFIFGMKRKT